MFIINPSRFEVGGTVTYTSDFSAGTDGWSGNNATVTGNVDQDADAAGQPPSDDWLKFVGNVRASIKTTTSYTTKIPDNSGSYTFTFDLYLVTGHGWITSPTECNVELRGSTTEIHAYDGSLSAGLNTGVSISFTANGSANTEIRIGESVNNSGDVAYIKNIVITQTA